MTTQAYRPSSGFDALVHAVADVLWHTGGAPETAPHDGAGVLEQARETLGAEAAGALPFPSLHQRSGVYVRVTPPLPLGLFEELRLDIDGLAPTMTVSGRVWRLTTGGLTWIARVTKQQDGSFAGPIVFRDGNAALRPAASVGVRIAGRPPLERRAALVTFSSPGAPDTTFGYAFEQSEFREVGIEFDRVEGAEQTDAYALHDHPRRPSDLPDMILSVEDAFSRQGIAVTRTGGGNTIPLAAAANNRWSDVEMHDAMQAHWSEWQPGPAGQGIAQWQVWTLFAGRHERPTLGGIMFDSTGGVQRQGCAVFSDSFISDEPPGDPDPKAFARRMRFWTAVHEIGHSFNLVHSWEKTLGIPWMPVPDEPEARSFMNYPFKVPGGSDAFFADFRYLFSEDELVFLRHAPERFVQQGGLRWADHHAFEQVRRETSGGPLTLTLRANRDRDPDGTYRYGMLEPVIGELRLANTSTVPVVVDGDVLSSDELGIVVQRKGATEAHVRRPYVHYCAQRRPVVLQPGEALYDSVVLSSDAEGWQIAEPGTYYVYAALRSAGGGGTAAADGAAQGQLLAEPLVLRVRRPAGREQELLADDVFTDEVGRVLALGGSRVMHHANDVLREVVDRIPEEPVATHAASCLLRAAAVPGKILHQGQVRQGVLDLETEELTERAYGDCYAAAETLGHIRLTDGVKRVATARGEREEAAPATDLLTTLAQTLKRRRVKPSVIQEIRDLIDRLKDGTDETDEPD
ncbi:hypothetical protein [Streptomyces sp. A012304]|uniref:hypothetical protein n=1 Tax=Streptomyces sp. A012304 TaxID=375446 RepID=UPI00223120A0|nr:hypothetical protein [Streptomyces sp. A012304]GKQ39664.1 hypothetical protein ALMP_61910 [Streptomyces sp. A012304]